MSEPNPDVAYNQPPLPGPQVPHAGAAGAYPGSEGAHPGSEGPHPGSGVGYPASGVPYPGSAVPYPASGLPYPASGMPASGMPYPYAAAPPPGRRGPWTVVLGVVAGVLLLAVGGVSTLYYLDQRSATQTSEDQQAQIAELERKVESLEDDLDYAETQQRRAEDELEDLQGCPEAVQSFLDLVIEAASSGTLPTSALTAMLDMMSACGVSL